MIKIYQMIESAPLGNTINTTNGLIAAAQRESSQIIGEKTDRALDARDLLVIARNVIDLLITITGGQSERIVEKADTFQQKNNKIEDFM